MLEELTEYKSFGSIHHLRAIALAVASAPCGVEDLFIIADSESAAEIPRVEESVNLLKNLGFFEVNNNKIRGLGRLYTCVQNSEPIETIIAQELFKQMLIEGVIPLDVVRYCSKTGHIYLNQHDISTRYSQMRNLLIEAGVFKVDKNRLILDSHCEAILQGIKTDSINGLSPEQLLKKLENDRTIGAAAEAFVMEYEKDRIGEPLASKIQQVSLVSVSAGYDIASFETAQSVTPDRFIEVKAIGNNGFYFSRNELETARRLGHRYCIYLVDMSRAQRANYMPEIIRNPSLVFSSTSDWRSVPESYHVTRME